MNERIRNLSRNQKLGLGVGAAIFFCCGCLGITSPILLFSVANSTETRGEITEIESLAEEGQETIEDLENEPESTDPPIPPTKTARPTNTHEPTSSPEPTNTPQPTDTPELELGSLTLESGEEISGDLATVVDIIDGDTIDVELNGEVYRVRYIGMDTPERGDEFYSEATNANRQLVEGQEVVLIKDVSETDRYGRLLRYVYLLDGTFVNAQLVEDGFALVATFPPDVAHESDFIALQETARNSGNGLWADVEVDTPIPLPTNTIAPLPTNTSAPLPTNTAAPLPTNTAAPLPTNTPVPPPPTPTPEPPQQNCDPSYPDVCIPPPPPDLDCGDIPYRRFRVLPPDPHRFDGDNDGIGCESG